MRKSAIYQLIAVFIAVMILSLLYFFYPATSNHFYPRCIFHAITGLYCPGCGSQRAISSLLHGKILMAISFNLLSVLSLPFIIYSAFVFTWNVFSIKKMEQKIFYSPFFIRMVLIIVITFWICRNIPVKPFTWLAPQLQS